MCLDVRARMPPSVTATAGPAVHGGFPLGEGRVVSKGGALSGGTWSEPLRPPPPGPWACFLHVLVSNSSFIEMCVTRRGVRLADGHTPVFLAYLQSCETITTIRFRIFSSPLRKELHPVCQGPFSSPEPSAEATADEFSASRGFPGSPCYTVAHDA